ncbi:MAG TPA: LPS assembly lipoprotein LptE [Acetobacteraceae bacterium]|nr:LPS assembly lipoprotein LptE [Acetobacteraceae bacterium]
MRLARRACLLVLLAAPLEACGFRPVYMPTASGNQGPAERELAAIHVNLIPERSGQLLRQALQQDMHGTDESVPPRYDLSVAYWFTTEAIAILPNTTATRVRFIAHANWTLLARDPAHTKVAEGAARAFGGVDVIDTQYFAADLQSEQQFATFARQIADQITLRLATIFRERAG